ncbi:MAG: hypothetical protein WDA27_13115 [Actinomycetota bacterium]
MPAVIERVRIACGRVVSGVKPGRENIQCRLAFTVAIALTIAESKPLASEHDTGSSCVAGDEELPLGSREPSGDVGDHHGRL